MFAEIAVENRAVYDRLPWTVATQRGVSLFECLYSCMIAYIVSVMQSVSLPVDLQLLCLSVIETYHCCRNFGTMQILFAFSATLGNFHGQVCMYF